MCECADAAAVVVWNDDGDDNRQRSNEAELSDNRQLKFPKRGGDLAGLKTV
jgi:hypothetical protein